MADYGGQNASHAFNVPSPYQTEQRRIAQQQKMAEMLQAQSMQPNERFSYNGIEARTPVTAGLAKMLQGFTSMMMQKKGLEEEKALGEKYRSERMGDMSELISGLNAPAVAGQAEVPARPAEIAPEERAQAADYGTPLPGAAIPAVIARAAGQIDPLMMGRMKTSEGADQVLALVMAQRQAQLEAERRANEPITLAEGAGRYQPMPGGLPAKLIAGGAPKTPFAPLDVSKYTPESLALAMKPDGTIDRTLLRAIPERATGELGVYNEYVKQQTAAGKKPMGIDQFIINQKIAGRTPAAETYGSPIAAVDAQGNPVFLQPGKTGNAPSVIQGFTPPVPKANVPLEYSKQATSLLNMNDALDNYANELKGFKNFQMALPSERARIGNAYQNTLLQAKEIYNLGVLNGPDERILQNIISNPIDFKTAAISTEALVKQVDAMKDIIKNQNKNLSRVYKQPEITFDKKLNAEDAAAMAWVKANPTDPRSAAIKKKLGQE